MFASPETAGVLVLLFGVPNDSSEDNAQKIAAYLTAEAAKDSRKFIVLAIAKALRTCR